MLTIGSLFSGIGGLERGLELAGLGPVRWQVERDELCRAVLDRYWPGVDRHDDVRTVGQDIERVDLICGGFPCQDVSSAGSRKGLAGARSGLWREFARIAEALRPEWIVVENVASGAKLWVDAVVSELGDQGYACLPVPLSAADVGAPHRRARIFVVAHAVGEGVRRPRAGEGEHRARRGQELATGSLGHAHREGQPARTVDAKVGGAPCAPADADGSRSPIGQGERRDHGEELATDDRDPWSLAQPGMVRVVHGVRGRLDSPTRRIRALGNSVVPQCAEVIGHMIREITLDHAHLCA